MSSEKRRKANRRNGALGKGHKMPRGRERTRFNAVKFGHTAKVFYCYPRDEAAYRKHRQRFFADQAPQDPFEEASLERCARISWLLRKADEIPAQAEDHLRDVILAIRNSNPGADFEANQVLAEKQFEALQRLLEILEKHARSTAALQKQLIAERLSLDRWRMRQLTVQKSDDAPEPK